MTYYITWIVDGPAILTAIKSDLDLTINQLMDMAFEIEEVEPNTFFEIASIIRAENAKVIY